MVADPKLVPKTGTVAGANDVVNLPMGVVDVKTSRLDTVLVATSKNLTAVPNGDPGVLAHDDVHVHRAELREGDDDRPAVRDLDLPDHDARRPPRHEQPDGVRDPGALNVNTSVSGTDVTLDPRTVPAS